MTVNLLSTAQPAYLKILSEAVAAFRGESSNRPSADAVVNALLQAEKAAKQQRLVYPFQPLLGHWQLCFATGTRKARQRGGILLGRGWYMPKVAKAQISFNALEGSSHGEIGNEVRLGPLLVKFTGPCRYLGKKKNLLAFDLTHMQIALFGRTLYGGNVRSSKIQTQAFEHQPISKLPFFAFFLITEDYIAARGRGGGLAIWTRERGR
ncbi:hypothetical protein [Leptothermofonsia sp. ETS-13]|uniref:hypothetical protein n=1 Tax=Leptothermofonsia sp. ETS-13 TaxID=3035696 RepID=UPI003B9F5731